MVHCLVPVKQANMLFCNLTIHSLDVFSTSFYVILMWCLHQWTLLVVQLTLGQKKVALLVLAATHFLLQPRDVDDVHKWTTAANSVILSILKHVKVPRKLNLHVPFVISHIHVWRNVQSVSKSNIVIRTVKKSIGLSTRRCVLQLKRNEETVHLYIIIILLYYCFVLLPVFSLALLVLHFYKYVRTSLLHFTTIHFPPLIRW